MTHLKKSLIGATLASLLSAGAMAGEVEVLHWWTSGGEAKAASALKGMLEEQGHSWVDFAVAGGGGENAMTVLKSRAMSGNPPTAAQIKGPQIQEWAEMGFLGDISSVAEQEKWDELLPSVVADIMKYEGKYVAAPVNVHRVNWLWANPDAFRKAGVTIPTTWDEFFVAAEKLQAAGIIPLAHGGQAWQDATVFDSIALAVGGSEFYKKAFIELDQDAIKSPEMLESLEIFKKLTKYIDKGAPGRDWNIATSMVIEGKAAMQIMGDWAKGEFVAAGKAPGTDFVCLPAPGTSAAFTFNIDSFAMFDVQDKAKQQAEYDLAAQILSPEFQEIFNLNKGSIPVRAGVSRDKFDTCAHDSMNTFTASAATGDLVPSWSHGMAMTSAVQGEFYDVITSYFNSNNMTAQQAVDKLAKAVKYAM